MKELGSWEEAKNWLVPINPETTKRKTGWVCSCSVCQQERNVTYAQAWNILKGNTKRKCRACQIESGELIIDKAGLELGRKGYFMEPVKNKPRLTKYLHYKHLFGEVSLETREKQRKAKLGKYGPLSARWQGGKTKERRLLMSRDDYKQLRKNVFERDNYTCQICQDRGVELQMDHIKEWCNYPELRYEITNCRTLCVPCHKKTDNYAHKAVRRIK